MSVQLYTVLGLTAAVAALVGALVFAVLRFAAAARDARERAIGAGTERVFMTAAIQEAVGRLKEQERHLVARAEASEQLSEEIVAGLTSGLMLVEAHGRIRLVNPAARRLLGLAPGGELPGDFREALVNAAPLADVVEETLRTGRPVARRTVGLSRSHRAAAGVTHLGVTVSPVVSAQRLAGAAICLFTDLTDVVALEEQVRLRDSLARLGELTAGLAHEFRNGLATIHGYAHMLDPAPLAPAQAACVEGIRQETAALGEVVANFLNFARPAQLALARVDLGGVVARAVDDVRPEAERHGGRIGVTGEFLEVEGDEVLLRQAFSNLCRNAVEACAGARGAPDVRVQGRVDAGRGEQVVVVSDNGPGIDAHVLPRIFQPFFTTRAGGTGLGLALVQKIVVTHNGRVTASSPAGAGAAFEIALPLAQGRIAEVSVS